MAILRALVVATILTVASAAGAAELKPHMATYKASMPGAPASVEVDGQIVLANVLRCKTWTVNQTSSLSLEVGGKLAAVVILIQQGEESADGRSMSYSTQMSVNNQDTDVKDTASASGRGKAGKAQSQPKGGAARDIELPDGTYFPLGASEKIIDELVAGKKSFKIRGFDPLNAHDVVEQTYTVVDSPFAKQDLPADQGGLLAGPSWIVKVGMTVGGQASETYLQIHRSGVTSRMLQNLGGARIEFTLDTVQPMPAMGC